MVVGEIDHLVDDGTAQIAIDEDNRLPGLRTDDGDVVNGGGFSFAGAAAQDGEGGTDAVLDLEIELGAQDAVAFGVR